MVNPVKNPIKSNTAINNNHSDSSKKKLSEDEFVVVGCGFIFCLLFFIIGVVTISYGCNTKSGDSCTNYISMPNSKVYKTEILLTQCKTCYSHKKNGDCDYWYYYDCYNGFAYFQLSGNKSTTCYKEVAYHTSKNEAESIIKKYPIGKEANLLKLKGGEECITPVEAYTNWIVGVVFLSLMGFCGLIIIITISNFWYKAHISEVEFCLIINDWFNRHDKSSDKNELTRSQKKSHVVENV